MSILKSLFVFCFFISSFSLAEEFSEAQKNLRSEKTLNESPPFSRLELFPLGSAQKFEMSVAQEMELVQTQNFSLSWRNEKGSLSLEHSWQEQRTGTSAVFISRKQKDTILWLRKSIYSYRLFDSFIGVGYGMSSNTILSQTPSASVQDVANPDTIMGASLSASAPLGSVFLIQFDLQALHSRVYLPTTIGLFAIRVGFHL